MDSQQTAGRNKYFLPLFFSVCLVLTCSYLLSTERIQRSSSIQTDYAVAPVGFTFSSAITRLSYSLSSSLSEVGRENCIEREIQRDRQTQTNKSRMPPKILLRLCNHLSCLLPQSIAAIHANTMNMRRPSNMFTVSRRQDVLSPVFCVITCANYLSVDYSMITLYQLLSRYASAECVHGMQPSAISRRTFHSIVEYSSSSATHNCNIQPDAHAADCVSWSICDAQLIACHSSNSWSIWRNSTRFEEHLSVRLKKRTNYFFFSISSGVVPNQRADCRRGFTIRPVTPSSRLFTGRTINVRNTGKTTASSLQNKCQLCTNFTQAKCKTQ